MTHTPPPMPGYQPPPPKRKRTKTIVISAAAVAAAGIGGIVFWLTQPTYDDIVKDCIHAIEEQVEGDKSKPDACQDVKDDDYTLIRMHTVLKKDGWFNEDGGVNRDKLINPDG
ncbi:hypothetical protein [Streptomyces iakyrus]|uniref:hypothetical protein n=1 Tax=Streptomyces iakyrus TaxID=68219 RepID=UPI0036A4FABA